MKDQYASSVLFVCLGNICRSPTAQAAFERKAKLAGLDVVIDSAGTSHWHIGGRPDPRSLEHGEARGLSFDGQAARQVGRGDFAQFDYILAMDSDNLSVLRGIAPKTYSGHLGLFLDFAEGPKERSVPDPYYGGADGFDEVIDLIEAASDGLIAHIQGLA